MTMTVNVILSFLFCMAGVASVTLATAKKDSATYVVRNGIANISWEIDRRRVDGYYVDVINPMKKRMFQCLRADPVYIAQDLDGKYHFYGNCSNGIISFSVFNATDGDAGEYISVNYLTDEKVGGQLLVVFAPFPMPDISGPKNISELEDSGLTLSCQVNATGTPPGHVIPVSYTWRRNRENIKSSTKYTVTNSKLKIKHPQRSDLTDQFTCLAWNDYGVMSPESTALELSQYSIYFESCEMSCIYGFCEKNGDEFRCVCKQGWAGLNCSTEINECSSNPCYRGTCYDKYIEYMCICIPGWTGKDCEIDIDDCASGPCFNGGSCNDLENDHTCQCVPGWAGKKCENAVHECSSENCVNGRCLVKLNSTIGHYCACNEGWSGTNCNTGAHGNPTSSIGLITGAVGGGCMIIAVFLLILGIWYRRHQPRVNTDPPINGEAVGYLGTDRVQSGHYCTIDDEQLYDIRRQIKSNVPDEAKDTNQRDGNVCFLAQRDMELIMDEADTDGYLHPTISIFQNSELEGKNILRNRQNSSSGNDCEDIQVEARDINPSDYNTCLPAEGDMEPVKDMIETDTDGYLHPIITIVLNSELEGKNFRRNSQNVSLGNDCVSLQAETRESNPSDCNICLRAEGGLETIVDGVETDIDGYLHPTISMYLNSELESENVLRNSQNASSRRDCDGILVDAIDTNPSYSYPRLHAEEGIKLIMDRIETDADGYLHPTVAVFPNCGLDGKNVLRNSENS